MRSRTRHALGDSGTAYKLGGVVGVSRTGVIASDFDTLTAPTAYVQDGSDT